MSVIRLLLTVPHLLRTSSPHREMMLMAEYLPAKNIHVTICSLRDPGAEETGPVLDSMGIPYLVTRFRPKGRSLNQITGAWHDQKAMEALGPFDIQHSLDFTSSPFEAANARLRSRFFVYSQRHINLPSQRAVLRIKASLAHRIHCNSIAAQQQLVGFGVDAAKLRMIYLGMDVTEIATRPFEQLNDPSPYILFVGHIQPRKRQEDAIRALAQLAGDFPSLRLLIAGSGYDEAYEQRLIQLTQDCGIKNRVEFLGLRNDVIDLMRGAQALILCSERESLSWSILEAMSAGIPVISAAVDGSLEVIRPGENGYLVEVGDVDGYAKYLRKIMEDKELNYRLGQAGRETVAKTFSIPNMIDQMAQMYQELVE